MIFLTLISGFLLSAEATYMPRLHEIKCKDMNSLAKEAVAYSLVGAWEPYTTKACLKGEVFKMFDPRSGEPEGDILDPSGILSFDKSRDKFTVDAIRKDGDEYVFDVTFTLNGKSLKTVYNYVPDPEYTGRTGICGFVVNEEHTIIRSDCFDKKKWAAIQAKFKK